MIVQDIVTCPGCERVHFVTMDVLDTALIGGQITVFIKCQCEYILEVLYVVETEGEAE